MATEGMQFPWRLYRRTISANLELIWEMSVEGNVAMNEPSATIQAVETEGRWITIAWADGHVSRFPPVWLRLACRCADCGNPDLAIRTFYLVDIPRDIAAEQVAVENDGGLAIVWSHGGHASRYDAAWLRRHCLSDAGRRERRFRPVSWGPEIANHPPQADYAAAKANPNAQLAMLEKVLVYGFVLLDDVPVDEDETVKIVQLAGDYRPGTYGLYDVKYREQKLYYGDDGVALEPHSDEPYRSQTAAITVFHPMVASGEGGDSILVDGIRTAEVLRENDPEAFRVLSETPFPHRRLERDNHHHLLRAPIISRDREGGIVGIRFNDRYMTPLDLPEDEIEPAYNALRAFAAIVYDPAHQLRFKLEPGRAMIFNNQRVLHGRTAYDPVASKRHLRHCNTDLDSFHSKLRLLYAAAGRPEAEVIFPAGAML